VKSAMKIMDHSSVNKRGLITQVARRRMIAEAAYYMAEKRGFQGDCKLHDWLEAEIRINRIYGIVEQ